jgi:hypothetical protein
LQGRPAAIWPGPGTSRFDIYLVSYGLSKIRETAVSHPERFREMRTINETFVDIVLFIIKICV